MRTCDQYRASPRARAAVESGDNSRVRLGLVAALAVSISVAGCEAPPRFEQKLVILGFDGLDARLTERWIAAGLLPNMAALAAEGGFRRLETTPAAETASAWTTWATGVGAGVHGIFDAITPAAESRLLRPAPPRMILDRWPASAPGFAAAAAAPSFWSIGAGAGVRASVLTVPGTFPPEPLPGGELLSGFPLPAIDESPGTYAFFATDLHELDPAAGAFPAIRRRLQFVQRVAHAELPGPRRPQPMSVPFRVTWNREARTVNVDIAGETLHLAEGQWSRWVAVPFRYSTFVTRQGMTQFYLHRAGVDFQLYAAPIQWHPAAPQVPISYPATLSAELYERLGPFRTLPRPGTTGALANGDIDEQVFLDDLDRMFDDRAAIILNRLEQPSWDLLIGVVEATDDVQHVMWRLIDPFHPAYDADLANRHGDAIRRFYRRADTLVGQVRAGLPRDAVLIVLSPYGFHPFRAAVDLNGWLASRGYLTRSTGQRFPESVDWTRTRAYALGAGQIDVNLKGRQPHGIVAPGSERDALVAELRTGLKSLVDLSTGRRVAGRVDVRDDVYAGPLAAGAPDLTVGFAHGYRASWSTIAGLGPAPIVAGNRGRWSGDHTSSDHADTPGVFIASRKPAADRIPPGRHRADGAEVLRHRRAGGVRGPAGVPGDAGATITPMRSLVVAIVACAIVPAMVLGQEEDPKAQAARAAARIKVLRQEADRLAVQARTVFGELRRLEVEQQLTTQQLVRANADLAALTRDRNAAMKTLATVEARRVAETPGIESRLVEIYKRGRGGYTRLLLSSDDVRSFGRTTRGVAALAAVDRARLEAHRRTVAAERAALADVERRRAAVAATQKDAAAARAALTAAVTARNRLIDELDQRRDLAARVRRRAGGRAGRAAADRRQPRHGRRGGVAAAAPPLPRRSLDWPVNGRVSARFGKTPAGRFSTSFVRNGINIEVAEGTPVRAIHGGMVGFAAPFTGYGTMVIVDHGGGAFSLYGHLAETAVKAGMKIARGAEVGTVAARPTASRRALFRAARRRAARRSPTMAEEFSMKVVAASVVLLVSVPVIAFAVIGGFMGNAIAPAGELPVPPHLRRRRHADHEQLRRGGGRGQGDARRHARAGRRAGSGQRLPRRQAGARRTRRATAAPAHRPRADPAVLPARDRGARRLAGVRAPACAGRLHPRDRRPVDARHLGLRRHARCCAARPGPRSR